MPNLDAFAFFKQIGQSDFISNIGNDIRLAVDTGKVTIGNREVTRTITDASARVVVVAAMGKKEIVEDIIHMCGVAQIRIFKFKGNSLELGALCGKPYSVNAISVIDGGSSSILNEDYQVD